MTLAKRPPNPTHNPAERALRSPVIHRKLSLGSQSENGERFAERALSTAVTCRMQRRSLFTYLSDLIAAHTAATHSPRSYPEPQGLNAYRYWPVSGDVRLGTHAAALG